MPTNFRTLLLRSAGAAALLAAGTAAASAQTVHGRRLHPRRAAYEAIIGNISPLNSTSYTYTPSGSSAAQNAFLTNTISDFGTGAPASAVSISAPATRR